MNLYITAELYAKLWLHVMQIFSANHWISIFPISK